MRSQSKPASRQAAICATIEAVVRIRGHNYVVYITLISEILDEGGRLFDFKQLKQVLQPTIEYLDHHRDQRPATIYRDQPFGGESCPILLRGTTNQVAAMTDDR